VAVVPDIKILFMLLKMAVQGVVERMLQLLLAVLVL